MSPLSTREVARFVGIHLTTLEEWLAKKKVKTPRALRIGAKSYRLWTSQDVQRIVDYKRKFYRKGRGRKKKSAAQ